MALTGNNKRSSTDQELIKAIEGGDDEFERYVTQTCDGCPEFIKAGRKRSLREMRAKHQRDRILTEGLGCYDHADLVGAAP